VIFWHPTGQLKDIVSTVGAEIKRIDNLMGEVSKKIHKYSSETTHTAIALLGKECEVSIFY
jgi:hypothetical protein